MQRRMIRMMCGVRLVDRVSTDVFCDRVGVVVKIENMIIQSRLRWHVHVRGGINSQFKSLQECVKKDLERYGFRREYAHDRKKLRERIRLKIANPGQLE